MGKMSNCDEAFKDNNSYCLIDKDMVSIPDIKSFSPGSETYLYPVSAHSCMTSSIPVYCTSCTQSSLILSQNTLRPGLVTSPIPHVKVESGVLTQIPTSPSSTETITLGNTGSNSKSSKNGEEFFTCRWLQCNERFHGLDDLVNHVNDQHVKLERPDVEFQCKWTGCSRQGRGFNARYKMLIHIRTHTNEKPHCCTVCNKSFSRLENLKIHHRSHTGEKPYNCPYPGCNKAYSNSSDRFKHVRTHQEQKPYICKLPGCNKRYTDPSSLRKHVRTHKHFVPTQNVPTPSVNTKKKSPKSMKGDNSTSTVIADKPISNEVNNKTNESTISKAFDPVLNHSDPTVLMQFPTILMNSSSPFTKSSASEMAEVTSIINVVPLVMTSSPDTSNSSDYQDGPLDLSRSPASPHYSIGTSFSPG